MEEILLEVSMKRDQLSRIQDCNMQLVNENKCLVEKMNLFKLVNEDFQTNSQYQNNYENCDNYDKNDESENKQSK